MMSLHPYRADWWYRHHEDPDQSVRQHCQMLSGFTTADELNAEIQRMRQHYTVQRVVVQPICARCQSNGQIVVRRFKRRPPRIEECPECHGTGTSHEPVEWPLPPST